MGQKLNSAVPRFTRGEIAAMKRDKDVFTRRFAERVASRGGGSTRSIRRAATNVEDLDAETAVWMLTDGSGKATLAAAVHHTLLALIGVLTQPENDEPDTHTQRRVRRVEPPPGMARPAASPLAQNAPPRPLVEVGCIPTLI
jgi:hypothetical protein